MKKNKGYHLEIVTNEELAHFYESKVMPPFHNVLENEYLLLCDTTGRPVDKFVRKRGKLIRVEPTNFNNKWIGRVSARNTEQELAMNMLEDDDIKVKLLTGVFGSGKLIATFVK